MSEETANWQDIANERKKLISDDGLWHQIGYVSNDDVDCEPILLSRKHNTDIWPIVLTEPTGLNHPKYDWNKHQWVEQDAASNSVRLKEVEQKIDSVQQATTSVTQDNNALQQSLDGISKGQQAQSQQLAQLLQLVAPMVAKNGGGATNA